MKVLVTGGAGFIGSHTVVELMGAGHDVVIVDNLSNSSESVIKQLEAITHKHVAFHKLDVRDKTALDKIFADNSFDAVIHLAGLKAVGESVAKPLDYYQNNLDSAMVLCEVMQARGVKRIVFSSSATVYGTPDELPLKETSRVGVGITNPYGRTKLMIEQILEDLAVADKKWQVALLRYFNPIGAHQSGLIGEDPKDIPNNLTPYVAQVAAGKLEKVHVFGDDYDTPDGTGIRDYIHVVDLAKGHVAALDKLSGGVAVHNLGTGKGVSVLEMIRAFETVTGKKIPYVIDGRRAGDVAVCYADVSKANRELGWKAEKTVEDAVRDAWRWQQKLSS